MHSNIKIFSLFMFSYQAIDLWRDIPHYLKDLNTFSFGKEITEQYSRNLNSNLSFLITSISIICPLSLLLFFLFFFIKITLNGYRG